MALTVRLGMGTKTPAGRLNCHHCDSFSRLIKNKSGKSSWNGLISIECIDVPFVEVWRAILVIFETNCATIACNLKGWNGSNSEYTELSILFSKNLRHFSWNAVVYLTFEVIFVSELTIGIGMNVVFSFFLSDNICEFNL